MEMFEDISPESQKPNQGKEQSNTNNANNTNNTNNEETTLKAYKEALEQEWAEKNDPTNARETTKQTKEQIRKNVPSYLTNMHSLAMGAISESVKYQANKYLLDAALTPGGAGAKDVIADLFDEMDELKKDSAEATSTEQAND